MNTLFTFIFIGLVAELGDLVLLRLNPVRRARRTAWAQRWGLFSPARADRIERDAQRFVGQIQGWADARERVWGRIRHAAHLSPRALGRQPGSIRPRRSRRTSRVRAARGATTSESGSADGDGGDPPDPALTSPHHPNPAAGPSWPGDGVLRFLGSRSRLPPAHPRQPPKIIFPLKIILARS